MRGTTGGRVVQTGGQGGHQPNHFSRRQRAPFTGHDIEGIPQHEVLSEIRRRIDESSRQRRCQSRMRDLGGDQRLELSNDSVSSIGREIQAKELQGDKAVVFGVVRSENRSERSGSDWMQHAERTNGVRRRRADNVGVQRGYSSKEGDRW